MTARKSKAADPAPLVGAGLGRVAHAAYTEAANGKASDWDELVASEHDVAAAWCAAAQAVIAATIERTPGHASA